MTMDEHLCKSLVIWVGTFPNFENVTTSMLSDGVALANVLHQIAPEYFTNQWLSKIRSDVVDNWRLKVSNLKKIYQGVMDFFYHIELPVQAPTPDFNKIVENEDEMELGRLLQLVLGCAINCEQKQNHIESIMKMEENIQTLLVNAIQDLMNGTSDSIPGSPLLTFDVQGSASNSSGIWTGASGLKTGAGPQILVKSVMEQMEALAVAKEELNRRCNELDHQVLVLSEEKKKLEEDNSHFCEKIEIMQAGGDVGSQSFRSKDLRKQVETLRDELFKVETSRDELRSRVENSEKERSDLSARNEELQILADEARTLKDEVDALRDMSDRVALYEGTIGTYKKKLDELSDLKRQVKILEEKNSEYMQQNMDLEEEIKKSVTWRPQLDLYKKQVADLHQKLSDETKKTDRHLFENKKITDKLHTLTQEKERLLQERHSLKENVEELKCAVTAVGDLKTGQDLPDLGTLEIIPPEIREKLVRLQHENRVLKQKANDQSVESASVLQSMLNDLQERHNKLVQENRTLNQRIMGLECDVEDAKATYSDGATASSSNSDVSLLQRKLAEKNEKIASLEDALNKKEGENLAMEERYKKYLNKAKSVIKTLDPKHNPALGPDVAVLRSQLMEREKQIELLEKETEKSRAIREVEEKLITSAFYNFGMQMHRQMIAQRLSALESNQSFMARQRQATTRRNMNEASNTGQFFEY